MDSWPVQSVACLSLDGNWDKLQPSSDPLIVENEGRNFLYWTTAESKKPASLLQNCWKQTLLRNNISLQLESGVEDIHCATAVSCLQQDRNNRNYGFCICRSKPAHWGYVYWIKKILPGWAASRYFVVWVKSENSIGWQHTVRLSWSNFTEEVRW